MGFKAFALSLLFSADAGSPGPPLKAPQELLSMYPSTTVGLRTYLALTLILCCMAQLNAAPINHGDFNAVGADFLQVTENSLTDPGPLYAAPVVSGNSLDFSPIAFGSVATDGGLDSTSSTLTTVIQSKAGKHIPGLLITSRGEYALSGSGGAATAVSDFLTVSLDILEVDGIAFHLNLASSSSVGFNLAASGRGPFASGLWHAESGFEDLNQVLSAHHIPFTRGVTKLSLSVGNTLSSAAEKGDSSNIAKRDLDITIVPEPSTTTPIACATFVLIRLGICRSRRGRA